VGSFDVIALATVVNIMVMLPYNIGQILTRHFSTKGTFSYSSLPFPRIPLKYGDDLTLKSAIVYLPGIGDLQAGFSCITVGDTLTCGVVSDPTFISHPEEFMQIFHQHMMDFIYPENKQLQPQKLSQIQKDVE